MFFVELECPTEVVLQRLGMESRKRFGKLTDPDLYRAIDAEGGFEYAGLPHPDIQIDTTSVGPAEAAKNIADALRQATRT